MRAIILATGYHSHLEPLLSCKPSPLLNIAGKPIIFYVIENVKSLGVTQLEIILHHFPEQIEQILEEGKRWGVTINYHLVKDPQHPFTTLIPALESWNDDFVILGQSDNLPTLPKNIQQYQKNEATFFNYANGQWSGWGILSGKQLKLFTKNITFNEIPTHISHATEETTGYHLSVINLKELKKSNEYVITHEPKNTIFPTTAKKVEPGVWISRAVSIEPGVELRPPVFIGVNSHIKSGARIGPHAVIENNCLIDSRSVIENSLICQNSYVGETLQINDCIIDRNCLINLTHNSKVIIEEDFILSNSAPPSIFRSVINLFERMIAICLTIFLFPIFIVLFSVWTLRRDQKVQLPATENSREWKTFNQYSFVAPISTSQPYRPSHFRNFPALFNIIKGDMHFVGVPTRSIQEVEELPSEWKNLYLASKAGLLTLCRVEHGDYPTKDEEYASECYYSSNSDSILDLKIIWRWLIKKIKRVTS